MRFLFFKKIKIPIVHIVKGVHGIGNDEIKKVLVKRETQFIKTFFMVILCYIICVVPMSSIKLVDAGIFAKHSGLLRVFVFFWYLQFSINCFIYAVKSKQYRKAYSFFLKQVS